MHVNWYIVGWLFQIDYQMVKCLFLSFEVYEIESKGKW